MRRPLLVALLLLAVQALPLVGLPPVLDDWYHDLVLSAWLADAPPPYAAGLVHTDPFGLVAPFAFTPPGGAGSPIFPWWSAPDLRLAFWRPLSTLAMLLDRRLWPDSPLLAHLHSLGWMALLLATWWALLRRLLPRRLAALALVLLALDDAHWWELAWVANRNATIAGVFGMAAVLAHLRRREEGWRPGALLAPLSAALALLAGEAGLGALAFLAAYELVGRPAGEPPARRLRALAPTILVGLAWALAYKLAGFGAAHSAQYVDPLRSPPRWAAVAPTRLLALLGAAGGAIPSDLWLMAPAARPALVVQGLVVLAGAAWVLRDADAWLDAPGRRALRWLALGGLLALLPFASTFPLDRLLLIPALGAQPLVAAALLRLLDRWRRREAGRWFLPLVAWVHAAQPVLVVAGGSRVLAGALARHAEAAERAEVDPATLPGQRVWVVASDPSIGLYGGIALARAGRGFPASYGPLSMAPCAHRLTVLDARTLRLETRGCEMLQASFEGLFRDADTPLRPGDIGRLPGMTAAVEAVGERGPTRVRFRFDLPLDDPGQRFLAWRDGTLRRIDLPPPGGSLDLPWEPGPFGL